MWVHPEPFWCKAETYVTHQASRLVRACSTVPALRPPIVRLRFGCITFSAPARRLSDYRVLLSRERQALSCPHGWRENYTETRRKRQRMTQELVLQAFASVIEHLGPFPVVKLREPVLVAKTGKRQ